MQLMPKEKASWSWYTRYVLFSGRPTTFRSHHYNTRNKIDVSKGDMLSETRKLLEDFYRPHNAEMYKLTGDKTFLYNY